AGFIGFKEGDIIVSVAGKNVQDIGSFVQEIERMHEDLDVPLKVIRNGREQTMIL
ncbi:PDZ domain-containing protein, partial [Candidatus Bathyarchaeota archaeon]|nr:PDZ domain-containing protein [Candidatus Bathyarchaeota archaeon]